MAVFQLFHIPTHLTPVPGQRVNATHARGSLYARVCCMIQARFYPRILTLLCRNSFRRGSYKLFAGINSSTRSDHRTAVGTVS